MQLVRRLTLAYLAAVALSGSGCGPTAAGSDGGPKPDAFVSVDDADGDGISDHDEGRDQAIDTDGDGTPDYLDDDSDGDGVPDSHEAGDADPATPPVDSDSDGTPDFRDTDSDGNGRLDAVDGTNDFDNDGIPDFQDLDDDGDMIKDTVELGPDPQNPVDTDGDTLPDFQDADSDNDTIADRDELMSDPDMDGIPAFRDLDSDGDCRPDSGEAGDADYLTPPVDSDMDGRPDFLDLDSDNDGLSDQLEDLNCNGVVDMGETSPTNADTDGDGITDLIEVAAGTNPTDPASNPHASGDFVFLEPYNMPPSPPSDVLDFSTSITQADVFFVMDTTGSMGGEINNLKSSLATVISTLSADIPDMGFGVGGHDDFPNGTNGTPPDQPFYLLHRILTTHTAAGLASVQAGVNMLTLHNGNDGPESQWEAAYQIATGAGVSVSSASVPPFNPATAPPASIPAGESVGTIGGVGFRTGSLPIVVEITDIHGHNSESFPGDYYPFGGAAFRSTAMTAEAAIGIRHIALTVNSDAQTDQLVAVNASGATVPPDAWGPVGTRPGGCALTQCCTGLSGAGQAPDGTGMCPLDFQITSSGTGIGASVIKAIEVLTTYGTIDITATIANDPTNPGGVDAVVAFVDHLAADPTAPSPCASGLTAIDTNGDGILDTFQQVQPGTVVCFDVVPKMNTTIMSTDMPQIFRANITVVGDGITTLSTRHVFFLVPPVIPNPPIN